MAPAASPWDALFAAVDPALGSTHGDRNLTWTPFVSIASRLRQVVRSRAQRLSWTYARGEAWDNEDTGGRKKLSPPTEYAMKMEARVTACGAIWADR